MFRRLISSRGGFTLIEIMIVIAIIAILAAILIPNYVRARGQSQLTACESNVRNIVTAVELYGVDNRANYPPSQARFYSGISPNYMRQIPVCPTNNSTYGYATVAGSAYTDYIVFQTGSPDPHWSFETKVYQAPPSSVAVCQNSGDCLSTQTPQYIGSQGMLTGH